MRNKTIKYASIIKKELEGYLEYAYYEIAPEERHDIDILTETTYEDSDWVEEVICIEGSSIRCDLVVRADSFRLGFTNTSCERAWSFLVTDFMESFDTTNEELFRTKFVTLMTLLK